MNLVEADTPKGPVKWSLSVGRRDRPSADLLCGPLVVLVCLVVGCTDVRDDGSDVDIGVQDDSGAESFDGGSVNGNGGPDSDSPNSADDAFSKPDNSHHEDHWDREILPDGCGGGAVRGRDHMAQDGMEGWLYEGEYFVEDGVMRPADHAGLPVEYEFFVLMNGKSVPFEMVEVTESGEFPSIEEIQTWAPDRFQSVKHFVVDPCTSFHYTLVIPPGSFPAIGGHNLSVIAVPNWSEEHRPDGWHLHVKPHQLRARTVYYGREQMISSPRHTDETRPSRRWDYDVVGQWVYSARGLFLTPDPELYDWPRYGQEEHHPFFDADFTRVFETSDATNTVWFHVVGRAWGVHLTEGEGRYHIRQDGELIDVFTHEPPTGSNPAHPGDVIEIDVEIPPGETSAIEVVLSTVRADEPYIEEIPTRFPVASNRLLIKNISE